MISLPAGTRVWLAVGRTDMRKGFDGKRCTGTTDLAFDVFRGSLHRRSGRAGCAAASARPACLLGGAVRVADGASGRDGGGDLLMCCGSALPFFRRRHIGHEVEVAFAIDQDWG
jgi:hypothetical protein